MANADYKEKAHGKSLSSSHLRSHPESGFKCEFIDHPPRRSQCPICLLVPRDPQQTPCCGNAFCRACIRKISDKNQPCPTCKEEDFNYFSDKGLQQELQSSRVHCTNKSGGCQWEGELRELEVHLNSNPENDKQTEGCQFQLVNCTFCLNAYLRSEVKEHQNQQCGKRPFTCPACNKYKSTYDNVTSIHQPSCKCHPVDCPNKCGQVVQYQKLKDHLSSECELSEVECEFCHAGCKAKMPRRDLPSHMTDNMVTHMSLLARENRKLKLQLQKQTKELRKQITDLELERNCNYHIAIFIMYPWRRFVTDGKVTDTSMWYSKPFYYKKSSQLQLCVWCDEGENKGTKLLFRYTTRQENPYTLLISTSIRDNDGDKIYYDQLVKCTGKISENYYSINFSKRTWTLPKEGHVFFFINSIEEVQPLSSIV